MPHRDDDLVPVSRSRLTELISIALSVAHGLKFTDPPQEARHREILDYVYGLQVQAGITVDDLEPKYRAWFHELALYFAGWEPPKGDDHFEGVVRVDENGFPVPDWRPRLPERKSPSDQ